MISKGGRFEHIVDPSIRLWDAARGAELGEIPPDSDDALVLTLHAADTAATNHGFGRADTAALSPNRAWSAATEGQWWAQDRIIVRDRQTGQSHELPIQPPASSVQLAWFPDNRHLAVATDQLIVFDVAEDAPVLRVPLRAMATRLFVVNQGAGILVGDHERQYRIFAVEGVDARGEYGAVPEPSTPDTDDHPVQPLQPNDPNAWFRMIRGMLVNQDDSSDDEVRRAFEALVACEATDGLFGAAIVDPYSESVAAINADLWYVAALFLWRHPDVAERCLRTVVYHDADRGENRRDPGCQGSVQLAGRGVRHDGSGLGPSGPDTPDRHLLSRGRVPGRGGSRLPQ